MANTWQERTFHSIYIWVINPEEENNIQHFRLDVHYVFFSSKQTCSLKKEFYDWLFTESGSLQAINSKSILL